MTMQWMLVHYFLALVKLAARMDCLRSCRAACFAVDLNSVAGVSANSQSHSVFVKIEQNSEKRGDFGKCKAY